MVSREGAVVMGYKIRDDHLDLIQNQLSQRPPVIGFLSLQDRVMLSYASLVVLAALPAFAQEAQVFVKPASSPFSASSNYVGQSNGTLPKTNVTSGKVFDRFIQIWLENTDYQSAASTPQFQALAKEGLLLDAYYSTTHVSHRPRK
jgi:hypothetical protein